MARPAAGGVMRIRNPAMSIDAPQLAPGVRAGPSDARPDVTASPTAIGGFLRSVRRLLQIVRYRATCHIFSHPGLLKAAFAVLRVVRPVTIVGRLAVVTRAADIRDVLERFDDFITGDVIEPGTPWGSFLMTIDWREQHQCERGMLESVVRPAADMAAIRAIAAGVCRSRIAALAHSGRLDVVADLAEPVMVRIFADYIGVPPLDGSPSRMARAMRNLAGIIMVNPPQGSQAWRDSRADMTSLTRQLLNQLAIVPQPSALEPSEPGQTLFARLRQRDAQAERPSWFDDDWIRRYLTGLVATGGATIIRGTTHAVDRLLDDEAALQRARHLAQRLDRPATETPATQDLAADDAGAQAEKTREALRQCIYEALRFRPMLPLLVRDCPRRTIIAKGTARARLIPAGTRVIASPLAAMFDPEAFPNPSAFSERPLESYFHFGFGPRRCFGKYIADIAMLEIVRALAALPQLARASGAAGRVRYEGPAPCALAVTFAPFDPGATP